MPTLNIIIGHVSKPVHALSHWLAANRQQLLEGNFQTYGSSSPAFGPVSVNPLFNACAKPPEEAAEKAARILAQYVKATAPVHDLIWLGKQIPVSALERLKSYVGNDSFFSEFAVKIIIPVQNPALLFLDQVALRWQLVKPENLLRKLLNHESGPWYGDYLARVERLFGAGNCIAIPFNGDYQNFAYRIKTTLGLPKDIPDLEGYPWPLSFAGLDMAHSMREFPFEIFPQKYDRTRDFLFPLVAAEKKLGLEIFRHFPENYLERMTKAFTGANSAFIKERGEEFAFLNEWPVAHEMSGARPHLDSQACAAFLGALNPDLQDEMRKFFQINRFRDANSRLIEEALAGRAPRNVPKAPRKRPMLSVLTLAYNHKHYIRHCLDSVTAQVTDFPIEHIIVDDGSNDGTQDIIDDYAASHDHVRPIYLIARGRGRNIERLFNACASPYAALCDGDDYFTDPRKLQKQVDFLEKNRDCSLCFHYVEARYENNEKPSFVYPDAQTLPRGVREKYYLPDLLRANFIQTNSAVYRWRFRDGLPDWFNARLCPADWYWHLLHAEMGKIGFIPEIMSVYRRHPASIYATSFQSSSVEHRRRHGLGELATFQAVNDHFKNRYFETIASVANGVFSDYCKIYMEEDDSSYLDKAVELYPQFGAHFLSELKNINASK